MRRLLASLAMLGLLAALVPTVSANQPYKSEIHSTAVGCDGLEGPAGTVFFGVSVDDTFGPDGYLDLWVGTPFEGPSDLTRDWAQPVEGSTDATSLHVTIPLVDAAGDAAGVATVDATLETIGDPLPANDRFHDGNQTYHAKGTFQPLAVTGTLDIAGAVYDLSPDQCYGDRTDQQVLQTAPNALVRHYDDHFGQCDLSDGSNTGSVFFGFAGEDVLADFSLDDGPAAPLAGYGDGLLVDGSAAFDLSFYDPATGDPTDTTGAVTVSFERTGDRYGFTAKNATSTNTVSGEILDVSGTLSVDGGPSFSLDSCFAFDGMGKEIMTNPRGPKPGGKVPANDLPTKATTLTVGSRTTIATKGASPDAEAPYECLAYPDDDGSTAYVPVGNTVWYKVAGTGGTVTVDTAGSDYDTVAAVYTADGSGGWTPEPGACDDDVPLDPLGVTLQAAVSFPTTAGVWYYVQIGGYPEAFPYGTLKVAVR
jgi:hypothetical protein